MAWGSIGTLGSANDKVAGTSISLAVLGTVVVGRVIMVGIAKDNASTTDGNTNEITSVTDTAGNAYVKALEYCNSGSGAANGGVVVALYYTKVTVELAIAGLITANVSDSRTSSAITAWEYSIAGGNNVSVVTSTQGDYDAGTDYGSLDLTTPNSEHLWVRVDGWEGEKTTQTYTTTAAYSSALSENGTTGGTSATNIWIFGEWDIVTGTTNASDPSLVTTSDKASVLVAFKEASAQSQAPRSMHQRRLRVVVPI